MGRKKRSFARFYAIVRAKGIDLGEHKEALVAQFTDGRTASLGEMTPAEYDELCACLETGKPRGEASAAYKERLRRARSAALNRMQRLGVDTADWNAVDRFCLSPRIAGKPFGMLTVEELQALVPKLEAILRKPRPAQQQQEPPQKPCPMQPQRVVQIPVLLRPDQLPS